MPVSETRSRRAPMRARDRRGIVVSHVSEHLLVGVASQDVAWTIVLVLCGAVIVWPFLFLFLAKRGGHPDERDPDRR
jgi:hypothetical protein